mmetsp:Transcript_21505/g.67462  ORF Transcript_21505/g.67462 Transcript_21505/m.67462 type:complete len:92 (+) Transcript_21505:1310-1585(+)
MRCDAIDRRRATTLLPFILAFLFFTLTAPRRVLPPAKGLSAFSNTPRTRLRQRDHDLNVLIRVRVPPTPPRCSPPPPARRLSPSRTHWRPD